MPALGKSDKHSSRLRSSRNSHGAAGLKRLWIILGLLLLVLAGVWLGNRSGAPPPGRTTLLAHRGIAQRFDERGLTSSTCTARRMVPPRHALMENTIPSMRAAFAAGADVVEIDVQPTTDGQFAVFHDWTLDCRTDGQGVTRDHSMADLRRLDIGYGYTADGGRTFPFRGRFVGRMPSLAEVLAAFPDRRFNINVKSNDPEEGRRLAAVLGALPPARQAQLIVYGGDRPIAEVRARLPAVRTASRGSLIGCFIQYDLIAWTGWVPPVCRRMAVLTPVNVGPWLWGWPNRYLARMRAAGSEVYILGPYRGGGFSSGVDTPEDLRRLPPGWTGGVWTNEIETIAPAVVRRDQRP